jgi:hypothetical protein
MFMSLVDAQDFFRKKVTYQKQAKIYFSEDPDLGSDV